ncbi:MAG: HTH-type transcriptional regulator LysM [Thermoprotei archaeon]
MQLDPTDLKIIELLKSDARISYTELARQVGISEAAVRKRINKLISHGVIKRFTIDYELENEIRAFVFVKTSPQIPAPEISKKLVKISGVETVYETTGEYDIVAFIRGPNITAINRTIDEIRSVQGIISTNSTIILRTWY